MSPSSCRGRPVDAPAPAAAPSGRWKGLSSSGRRCEERGPEVAGEGRARQGGSEPAAYGAQLCATRAGRMGRVRVTGRAGTAAAGRPGSARRCPEGGGQVAPRPPPGSERLGSCAARSPGFACTGPGWRCPRRGRPGAVSRGLQAAPRGLQAAPRVRGALGLSPLAPLSLPAHPAAPDVTPAPGAGAAHSRGCVMDGPKVGGGAGTRLSPARPGCEGIWEQSQVMEVGAPGTAAAAEEEEEEKQVTRVGGARPLRPRGGLPGESPAAAKFGAAGAAPRRSLPAQFPRRGPRRRRCRGRTKAH